MHHAPHYVSTMGQGQTFLDHPLNAREARHLASLLKTDATNYLYSACISIAEALHAADRSLFTWATVKLYYSVFYMLRSSLALSGRVLAYNGTKPRTLLCQAGELPNSLTGNTKGTHQSVITYFSNCFPTSTLLSQDILGVSPFKWLMQRREDANYGAARFGDPNCPQHFIKITQLGVRRATSEYINDESYLFAFDPEHAVIALPIEVLKNVINHPELDVGANLEMDVKSFFRSIYIDKAGPITDILKLLKIQ